ncbi:uncharacterized protein LOC107274886 isoform X2 [Cephus cinctus]|uniref:Uncharacterized protein LOC107274886 isoform X2 n=1 Tax=Cephus cinctus TaxID=211228 RepID=A0AAJ7R7Z9_CEPCN|nr:uncharacterized protein LOC107274886 isoform X2 [Cephus cinctus]
MITFLDRISFLVKSEARSSSPRRPKGNFEVPSELLNIDSSELLQEVQRTVLLRRLCANLQKQDGDLLLRNDKDSNTQLLHHQKTKQMDIRAVDIPASREVLNYSCQQTPATRTRYPERRCRNASTITDEVVQDITQRQIREILRKIHELKSNISEVDVPYHCTKYPCKRRSSTSVGQSQTPDKIITDVDAARKALKCLECKIRELRKFFENPDSYAKIMESRRIGCCQEKLPHLHGFLDGMQVTMKFLESFKENQNLPLGGNKDQQESKKFRCRVGLPVDSELIKESGSCGSVEACKKKDYSFENKCTTEISCKIGCKDSSVLQDSVHKEISEEMSTEKSEPEISSRKLSRVDSLTGSEKIKKDLSENWSGTASQLILEEEVMPKETFTSENAGKTKGSGILTGSKSKSDTSPAVISGYVKVYTQKTHFDSDRTMNFEKIPTKNKISQNNDSQVLSDDRLTISENRTQR